MSIFRLLNSWVVGMSSASSKVLILDFISLQFGNQFFGRVSADISGIIFMVPDHNVRGLAYVSNGNGRVFSRFTFQILLKHSLHLYFFPLCRRRIIQFWLLFRSFKLFGQLDCFSFHPTWVTGSPLHSSKFMTALKETLIGMDIQLKRKECCKLFWFIHKHQSPSNALEAFHANGTHSKG